MQGIVGGVCPNHARVQCSGHGAPSLYLLYRTYVHSKKCTAMVNGGIFSLAFPTECFGTGEGLNPIEWESGRKFRHQTWVRHEMHSCCDVFYPRCSFPASSLRHGRCMEGGDTERPTFFLYNIHISHLSQIFTSLSRYIPSAVSSKTRLTWSDRTFYLPHSCNLGHTVVILLLTGP